MLSRKNADGYCTRQTMIRNNERGRCGSRRRFLHGGSVVVATMAAGSVVVGSVMASTGGQGWIGTQSYRDKLDNGNQKFTLTGRVEKGVLVEASGNRGQGGQKNRYDAYRIVPDADDVGSSLLFINENRRVRTDTNDLLRITRTMNQFNVASHPHYQWAAWGERTEQDKPRTLRRVAFGPSH